MPKQRGSESGKEAVISRGMDGLETLETKVEDRVSRKKQLQRLKPAEDERKLQTKRFVKQCVWRSQDRNHRLMKSGTQMLEQSRLKSRGFFCFRRKVLPLPYPIVCNVFMIVNPGCVNAGKEDRPAPVSR